MKINVSLSLVTLLAVIGTITLNAQPASTGSAAPAPAAAEAPPVAKPTSPAEPLHLGEVNAVVAKIIALLKEGKRTEAELAPAIGEFDAIVEKYTSSEPETAAAAMHAKGGLYGEVLKNQVKCDEIFAQLMAQFPGTNAIKAIQQEKENAMKREEANKKMHELVGKTAPAIDFKWSTQEGLKSLADLKGKVVVIDFWATWCGPCIRSFPEIAELVKHYEGSAVVVVGVTSIQGLISNLEAKPIECKGDEAKELSLLAEFAKKKAMTWPVAVSVQPVFNNDYFVSGIPHVAIIAPDGTVRANGINPSAPLAEKTGKIDAILKEFNLAVPAAVVAP